MPGVLSKPPFQRTIAITVGGIVIVLHTTVSGSIFVITGDGKQKCIEIKVAAPGPSRPLVAGANRPFDSEINVTATIRTMDAQGNTVKTEEDVDVKVEEWDDVEEKIVTSARVKSESAPAAELSASKQISKPSTSQKSKNDVKPKAPMASTPSSARSSPPPPRSSLASAPTIAKFAMPPPPTRSDASSSTSAMPPPKASPKKRGASELESDDPGGEPSGSKRVRVEAKLPRGSRRKTRTPPPGLGRHQTFIARGPSGDSD
ncbi:hypothetical protein C8R46DRAFT_1274255 [Mycena filopes]|nr:hypothetical protein C8R46DRAFT_1274255 [Mycena filopes]